LLDIYENKKKTPVLVIDEAHLLSPLMLQGIGFLINFQIDSLSPLALILVGQPELPDNFNFLDTPTDYCKLIFIMLISY
jgi:type II secretory pathway predicted ATPase ExeA